ncbi:unnamed protein product, partial [Rotaria sordida]
MIDEELIEQQMHWKA